MPITVDVHPRFAALWYRRVEHPRQHGAANVFVLEATMGRYGSRGRAVLYDYRDRRWAFDPNLVAASLDAQINAGATRMTEVDRPSAEAAAREFDQELPSEEELRRLMAEGAAALYGRDMSEAVPQ